MLRKKSWLLLIPLLCAIAPRSAHASEDDFSGPDFDREETLRIGDTHWEIGLGGGYAYALNSPQISQAFDLSKLPNLLDLIEEYTGDGRGPAPTGVTTIKGTLQGSYVAEGYLFNQLNPWLAVGLEGGYDVQHSINVTDQGALIHPPYDLDFSADIFHLTPALKVGTWLGPIRPYGVVGAGWYSIHQKIVVNLNDPILQYLGIANEDAGVPPQTILDRRDDYFGANWGGGLEVAFWGTGTFGVELRYHAIFAPDVGNNLRFLTPSAFFAYHF